MDMMWRAPSGGQPSNGKDQESLDEQRARPSDTYQSPRPTKNSNGNRQPRRGNRPLLWIVIVLILAIMGFTGYTMLNRSASLNIDTGKYQAVFLSNGQVYFGKLSPLNGDYMKLTDIYYLQSQQSVTDIGTSDNPQDSTDGNVQLIKLGEEIHGPEDEMVFSKEHLLFYENLKPSGNVTRSIDQHKNTR